MTWVKLDDDFPDHPKIADLTDKAFRLHVSGLCYCGRFLTDGKIPKSAIWRLGDGAVLPELLEAGLWEEIDGAYWIHDYLLHQSSKEQVNKDKEANRERVARHKEKSKSSPANGKTNGGTNGGTNGLVNGKLMVPDTDTDTDTELKDNVESLITLLADLIMENGSKRPTITKAWRSDMELLLRVDERNFTEAYALISWSQKHEFWRSNIFSPAKFRKQYDTLRLQSQAEISPKRTGAEKNAEKTKELIAKFEGQ